MGRWEKETGSAEGEGAASGGSEGARVGGETSAETSGQRQSNGDGERGAPPEATLLQRMTASLGQPIDRQLR